MTTSPVQQAHDQRVDASPSSGPSPLRTEPSREAKPWEQTYRRLLVITDTIVVMGAIFGAQGVRDVYFGGQWWATSPAHTALNLAIALAWLAALHLYGTRSSRVIGVGSREFSLIFSATLRIFGLFAIWCLLVSNDIGRGYMLVALPVGTTLLVGSRIVWRIRLRHERSKGRSSHQVVLLGSPDTALPVAADLRRNKGAGYHVLGMITAGPSIVAPHTDSGLPLLGDVDNLMPILEANGADTVVITGSHDLSPSQLRTLGWQLEDERYNLVATPSVLAVGGPRIHMSQVTGLSLLHIDTPRYEGAQRIAKRAFDLIGSLLILAIAALPMLAVAIAVRLSSPGQVLYRQTRIGMNSKPFSIIKFRSMRPGADAQLEALLAQQPTTGPLFKVNGDPRITPIGKVIRKYSIDELPQLLNVVRGEMSLVGPRPQVEGEVALYDELAHRRLLVKPGMTGLWQVSGRSNLGWEEAIALDLQYVANWSVATDLAILARTVKAVLAPGSTAH